MNNEVEARFRIVIAASAEGRDEYDRHKRVMRVLAAIKKWGDDPEFHRWYRFEQNLHQKRVKTIRASAMAAAMADHSQRANVQALHRDVDEGDPYALSRYQLRARITEWKQQVVEGRMTLEELTIRERQAQARLRKLIRVHAEIQLLDKTSL